MRICYVVAMVAEAQPFIERYGIQLVENFFSPLPCQLYEGEVNGATLDVVLNGQQQGSDLVGCEPASVATLSAIQRLHPDIVVNSGTCGAFRKNGADIAEVYRLWCHVPRQESARRRRLGHTESWQLPRMGGKPAVGKSLGHENRQGHHRLVVGHATM